MKARLKKQQQHDVVTGIPVQAKLLDPIRPMDSTLYSPQTPQTEDQQSQQTQQGFNFAEMPIFAGGAGSAPRVQPKFFTGDRTGKMNQQGVQAKLEPVQRAEEDEMQAKLEPVQRAEEDEMQAKLEPVQRAEEDEMQAKLEPVQRAEEDEMQAKLEPVQRAEEDEMQAKLEPVQRAEEDEMQAKLEPVQRAEEEEMQAKLEPVQRAEEDEMQAKLEPVQRAEEDEMQAKLEPVQRAEEEEMQAKLEPVQRAEEEEMQAKLEPVQRAEEDEMQAKLEPVQRAEEDEMQAKLEPVQRAEEEEMQAKLEPVQRKEGKPVNLALTSIGKPMSEPVQEKMEGAFGADFSGVRIHEGPQAKSINAIAYTQGSNIHFQPGKYQPDTQSGQELLGHELTHVVQQRAGRVSAPQRKGIPINADSNLETEADVLGAKAARGEQVQVAGVSSGMQRRPELLGNRLVPNKKRRKALKKNQSNPTRIDPIVYGNIERWLNKKAEKQKKVDLLNNLYRLSIHDQETVYIKICGGVPESLKDAQSEFKTLLGGMTGAIDWDKVSNAIREVSQKKKEDSPTSLGGVVLDVTGAGLSLNQDRHWGDRVTGQMDFTSMIGGQLNGIVAGSVAGAGAKMAVGSAFDAVDAASGGYKGYKGHTYKNAAREIQHATASEEMKLLAGTVKRTQGLERTAGAMDFAKGAGAAAVGAVVAAGALTSAALLPVTLVGIGITGIKIGYKMWKKGRNQERFVDQLYKIDGIKDDELRKAERNKIMQRQGFNSEEQVYNDFVVRSSQELYQKGVIDKDTEALALLEAIGLNVNHDRQTPKPEKIAQAMTP